MRRSKLSDVLSVWTKRIELIQTLTEPNVKLFMWPNVRESRTIWESGFYAVDVGFQVLYSNVCRQDSGFQSLVGFWIPWAVFQIPGTLFQCLPAGFWIPIVSGIPDSLSGIADSKTQDSGFFKQKFSGFRNTDSLTRDEGRYHELNSRFFSWKNRRLAWT